MISDIFRKRRSEFTAKKPFMTSKIKRLILKRNMAFKNKKVELVRSFRKRITAEIPRAKISLYENKVGSNLKKCPKSWWKHIEVFDG